jgi:hypothetical protein
MNSTLHHSWADTEHKMKNTRRNIHAHCYTSGTIEGICWEDASRPHARIGWTMRIFCCVCICLPHTSAQHSSNFSLVIVIGSLVPHARPWLHVQHTENM